MNLSVKSGYKLTEAGVLPEEWESKQFTEVTDLITCGIAATPQYVPESKGFPFLSSTNVKDGKIIWKNYKFISENLHIQLYKNNPPKKNDVLYSRVGTIGEAAVVDVDFEFSIYVSLTLIKPKKILDSHYLMHLLNSAPYKSRAKEQVYLGGGVGNLNVDVVRRYPIPIPSIHEQQKISSALLDISNLISNLDQLIAKKRDIQQATMQQLLTGQRRLPGFSGEWVTTRFSEIVKHHSGNSTLIKGKLSSEQIHGYFSAYSASGQDVWCQTYEHEGQAIIVSAVGSRCGKAFRADGKWSAIANTHIVWPVAGKVTIDFLSLFLNDENFWLKSGSGQPFVLFKQSFSRPLSLPSLEEQSAIAHTLEYIASEIERLNFKREKLCAIKTGMAQSLLTGKIRLISEA